MGDKMEGVKETKEALLGIIVLGAFVAERAKDGLQLNDLGALIEKFTKDEEFKAKLQAAVDGIDKVPAEVKDLSIAEMFELATVLPALIEVIDSMKK
jgi:hypothetical protein